MAKVVVSSVVKSIGDLLIEEAKFLSEWVTEIRELVYDTKDIVGTYALKVASKGGGGIKKVLKSGVFAEGRGRQYSCFHMWHGWPRKGHYCQDGFITTTKSSNILIAALGHISHNNVKNRCVWEEILIKVLSPTKEERDQIQKLTDAEIVEKLREVQLQKKCLVILDDILYIETWNSPHAAFPLKNIGSKILLTSRNKEVSLHVDTKGFLYELQCLNKERDCLTNANIESLGEKMIKYCGGLPLAITILGGLLATKQRQDERLAITLESNDNYFKGIKFSEYPYLRSLHYFVPPKEFYFKKSKLLRVLNLKNYGENFPKDIGCFIHLRFLSLKNSKISKVPSSLGNLRCLQTLDLRLKYYKVRVPNVFKEMEQLRHLYLPSFYWVSEKLELGNLCYLQTLLSVGLKTIKMPTSVRLNLRILGLGDHDYRPFLGVKTGEVVPHVIQVLSIFPHVYTLVIDSGIKKLPETRLFPPNLAELGLVLTKLEEDPMPTLEKLPNLKILRLFANSFVGKDMVCSEGGFPLLQYLILCGLYSLEEWRVEERAMPSLYHLTIDSCYYLKTIPDGLRFLTTLQVLEIKSMPKSFKDRLNEGGLDSDKVKHVPSLVFKNCDRE
ncbi:putative disease resistance protein [Quercus suber]|uniref:Disease resistance protein n=1 Tax=Quercus suber TaxID=58331 RepID=A0AAW0LT42_QUESU